MYCTKCGHTFSLLQLMFPSWTQALPRLLLDWGCIGLGILIWFPRWPCIQSSDISLELMCKNLSLMTSIKVKTVKIKSTQNAYSVTQGDGYSWTHRNFSGCIGKINTTRDQGCARLVTDIQAKGGGEYFPHISTHIVVIVFESKCERMIMLWWLSKRMI